MPDYAAVMVLSPVSGQWELMTVHGRVVVFDTAQMAWEWLPTLGQGRVSSSNERERSMAFLEISCLLPNRARVVSSYALGEAIPWKRHVIWTEAFEVGNREEARTR